MLVRLLFLFLFFFRWRESWTMVPRSDLSLQEKSPAKVQSIRGKSLLTHRTQQLSTETRLLLFIPCVAGFCFCFSPQDQKDYNRCGKIKLSFNVVHFIIRTTKMRNKKMPGGVNKGLHCASVNRGMLPLPFCLHHPASGPRCFLPWIFNARVHM